MFIFAIDFFLVDIRLLLIGFLISPSHEEDDDDDEEEEGEEGEEEDVPSPNDFELNLIESSSII